MAFTFPLSAEKRARLDAQYKELCRLFTLADRWLGEELLKLCREVRDAYPHLHPHNRVYDDVYWWHIVPDAARRLGAVKFRNNERTDQEIVCLSNSDFRVRAGYCIMNIAKQSYSASTAAGLLLNTPINGNALCYAVDRLASPDPTNRFRNDPIARGIAETAAFRCVPFDGLMTLELLYDYKRPDSAGYPTPVNLDRVGAPAQS